MGGKVRLNRHGSRTDCGDCEPSGDIGVRRHNHLVVGTNIESPQGKRQGIEPVRETHCMRGAAELGPFRLECVDLRSEDIPAALHYSLNGAIDFRLELPIGGSQVEERDFHWRLSLTAVKKAS